MKIYPIMKLPKVLLSKEMKFVLNIFKKYKNLTPSYEYKEDNKNKMSVKYYLCFCFNDEQGYEFYKHIEINIYRMNINDIDKEKKNFLSIKSIMKDQNDK